MVYIIDANKLEKLILVLHLVQFRMHSVFLAFVFQSKIISFNFWKLTANSNSPYSRKELQQLLDLLARSYFIDKFGYISYIFISIDFIGSLISVL